MRHSETDHDQDIPLTSFPPDLALGLPGPEWLRARRADALDALETQPMPSEKEEVWRYTPIDSLSLDDYAPLTPESVASARPAAVAGAFAWGTYFPSALGLNVADGVVLEPSGPLPVGVRVGGFDEPTGPALGTVLAGGDALVRLNDAFHLDVVVIDIADGVILDTPIVVSHSFGPGQLDGRSPATFPRTVVRLGRGARASVVEVLAGLHDGATGLVVPVTELSVGDGAHLSYVSAQLLGDGAWHIGRLAAQLGRDATLRSFTVGLGGAYDRLRTTAVATGTGSTTELRSAYLGTGTQIHDVRTLQDHAAAHTTSDLLCMGAVSGSSRSVYSGLIRVRRGAVRAQAFQTNHNLVLDPSAHADSVPNLDIEENDVRCSHASTVGPVDEDQRYYLESRGVPPERAERLIVLGFFADIVGRSPVLEAVPMLNREIGSRLTTALPAAPGMAGGELTEEISGG